MSDPEPVPPPGTAPNGTDGGTARYSVPEAARALGISERAVRKRITAGTLTAAKAGTAWVVFLPANMGAVPPSEPEPERGTGAVPTEPAVPSDGTAAAPGAVPVPAIDLAPLADLIERQQGEIARLTEAATAWQMRALRAEERIEALEAGPAANSEPGPAAEDAPVAAQDAPQRAEPAEAAPESPRSFWGRLRDLFGG